MEQADTATWNWSKDVSLEIVSQMVVLIKLIFRLAGKQRTEGAITVHAETIGRTRTHNKTSSTANGQCPYLCWSVLSWHRGYPLISERHLPFRSIFSVLWQDQTFQWRHWFEMHSKWIGWCSMICFCSISTRQWKGTRMLEAIDSRSHPCIAFIVE